MQQGLAMTGGGGLEGEIRRCFESAKRRGCVRIVVGAMFGAATLQNMLRYPTVARAHAKQSNMMSLVNLQGRRQVS